MDIKKHISWGQVDDVTEICEPLFNQFDLTYFDYGRLYNDGSVISLYTDRDFGIYIHNHREYKFPSTVIKPGVHLWMSYMANDIIIGAKHEFNHDYLLTIYTQYDDYCEVYDFATKPHNHKVLELYFNHLDIFELFI